MTAMVHPGVEIEAPRGRRRRSRATLLGAAVLAGSLGGAGLVAVDALPSTGPSAEAASWQCVMGTLATGAGFVALAADPPAGIAAVLSYFSLGAGTVLTLDSCRTHASTCKFGPNAHYVGRYRSSNGHYYAKYTGVSVGSGGGGGCSGSW